MVMTAHIDAKHGSFSHIRWMTPMCISI